MSSGAMPEITVTTTPDDGKIYLPYVINSNASNPTSKNSKVDIKLKKSSFKLDLEPVDTHVQTKVSPDTKNILSFLNGTTPIHVSPATDLEKLFPGSFLVTGSARNTPTTPPGVSFLLSNSDVTEESKEFADSFTAAYTSILQQQETQNEDANGQTSQFIDISQSLVQHSGQASLTLTPTLCNPSNQHGMSSRVYILTQQQLPSQDNVTSGPSVVSLPQTLPSVVPGHPVPRNDMAPTSVLLNGSSSSAGPGITNFHSASTAPVAGSRRPAPGGVPPAGQPLPKQSRPTAVVSDPVIDTKMSTTTSSTASSAPSTPSQSNYNDQDQSKLERKRARNRDAARRCRDRKMGKIITLEQKVKSLNDENRKLRLRQAEQREQLVKLKALALDHFQKGCNFEFDLSRVDAALSSTSSLKKEPDGYDDLQ